MKTQCSIAGSQLGSLTESPLKALQGNDDSPIEIWRVSILGFSTTPAFCKYSCVQASGDDLTDALNYFQWCTSHTWDSKYNGGASEYKQTDDLDGSTFEALSANVDIDTDNYNGGQPPTWNNQAGYIADPSVVGTAVDWDPSSTRTAIMAALDGVNWTALWAGSNTENSYFQFDRVEISPNQSGQLPFGGTATGNLLAFPGLLGPDLVGAASGFLDIHFSGTDQLGISLERVQLQIRHFRGPPIDYFIYERIGVAAGVTILENTTVRSNDATALKDTDDVVRLVSAGQWNQDLQIIQLPDGAMDGPQIINTSFGDRVRNGTLVGMVLGKTFADWMLEIFGPSCARSS